MQNVANFVGGNRVAHQMYVAHQIRLLNTILGFVKGKLGANPIDIAAQNRAFSLDDHFHLKNIIHQLVKVELVDTSIAEKMAIALSDVFEHFFPRQNSTHKFLNKGSTN